MRKRRLPPGCAEMESDWSVACAADDPWIVVPWSGVTENDPSLRYFDLRAEPERVHAIPDAARNPALADALLAWNRDATLFTAKCDVWQYGDSLFDAFDLPGYAAAHASYVDLVPLEPALFSSFPAMEGFVRRGSQAAAALPAADARCEWTLRRARVRDAEANGSPRDGFACTLYVWGYGADGRAAQHAWGGALHALIAPVLQLFSEGPAV
jgi:hypothetical protein